MANPFQEEIAELLETLPDRLKEVEENVVQETLIVDDDAAVEVEGEVDQSNGSNNIRFSWLHKLVLQKQHKITNVKCIVNPFLNDLNYQDLVLSELIVQQPPYRMKDAKGEYLSKSEALLKFTELLQNKQDERGMYPLKNITSTTVKRRFTQYLQLQERWFDKNGAILVNFQPISDHETTYNQMSISQKIHYNVKSYIEDFRTFENEVAEKTAQSVAAAAAVAAEENEKCNAVTLHAMGYSMDSSLSLSTKTPAKHLSGKTSATSTVSGNTSSSSDISNPKRKGMVEDALCFRNLASSFDSKQREAEMRRQKLNELHTEREKRKAELFLLEKERFAAEKKHREEEAARQNAIIALQQQTLQHKIEMDKEWMKCESERNKTNIMLFKVMERLIEPVAEKKNNKETKDNDEEE